jgi:collagen triple helix repeat protein
VQRLSVALAAAALAVSLLGSTSLGRAARDGIKAGVKAAAPTSAQKTSAVQARGPRGLRGRRGFRGARGPRGFQGPPGDKGDRGDLGSNAYEFKTATQTPVVGNTADAFTIVAAPQTALPAGKYAITAQILLEGSGGRTYCRGRGPGPTGPYLGQLGSFAPTSSGATLTLAFGADLPSGGTINVACWQISGSGAMAGPVDLVALKVGELTAIS